MQLVCIETREFTEAVSHGPLKLLVNLFPESNIRRNDPCDAQHETYLKFLGELAVVRKVTIAKRRVTPTEK